MSAQGGLRWGRCLAALVLALGPGCKGAQDTAPGTTVPSLSAAPSSTSPPAPMPIAGDALFSAAESGDPEDALRLLQREGTQGLIRALSESKLRVAAIHGLGQTQGLGAVRPLVRAAEEGAEAELALRTAVDLIVQARRSADVDAPEEVRDAGRVLAEMTQDDKRSAEVRGLCLRALRLLVDRGAVLPSTIPAGAAGK